jgi:Uma2 family endonuclease
MSATLEPRVRRPRRYEVVAGKVLPLRGKTAFASEVANRIGDELACHGRLTGHGRPRMRLLFRLNLCTDPTRCRAPAVSFTSFERWPAERPLPYRGDVADIVPELIVEVASPNDEAEDLLGKAHEYLEAGAKLVWLVYPRLRVIHAYESPTKPRVFTAPEELDGGTVLPDFRVRVDQLFPPMIPEPPSESDE